MVPVSSWYILDTGIKRFHTVTWFGSASYRKFRSEVMRSEDVCLACGEEMDRCAYVGKRHVVKDVGHPEYVAWFLDDEFNEHGKPNFVDVVGGWVE